MWGQDSPRLNLSAISRIIPTRVGTSFPCFRVNNGIGDHPHACGDKKLSRLRVTWIVGSSPRVWGQVFECLLIGGYLGIIPTRVGTSGYNKKIRFGLGDHPHACGDKRLRKQSRKHPPGSSPRVWGQGTFLSLYIK